MQSMNFLIYYKGINYCISRMPEQFQPTNGFTEKELNWSYWFVTNKLLLRKIFIIALISINALFMMYVIYALVDNFILKYNYHQSSLQSMAMAPQTINSIGSSAKVVIADLEYGTTQVLRSQDKYDLLTPIHNPNDRYVSYFSYRYVGDGFETDWKEGYVLPNDTTYLFMLGMNSVASITAANLEFKDIDWEKQIDFKNISDLKFRFAVDNITYTPSSGENKSIARFDVKNNSAYNYRQVGFITLLKRQNTIVGINYIQLNNFKSQATRNIEAVWFEDISSVSNVTVIPTVNYLDDAVFIEIR